MNPQALRKITDFTKLFWANRGNHNDNDRAEIPARIHLRGPEGGAASRRNGGGSGPEAESRRELDALKPSLFDPNFEPTITAKSPQGNRDILQASANNFYQGLSLADLKGFQEKYPLNSRLVKTASGKLVEEVYRAGTPDGKVPPGRYARYLKKANEYLDKARAAADPEQAEAIAALIRYYQTGDPADWLAFDAAWVQNNARVDFANGFIEVYRDARAAKGTSQSFVTITDEKMNQLMLKLAANAQYFEDRAPWAQQYKKQGVKPPLAKAVRDADRDRRLSRRHHRRQPAQRKRDPREVRQQELPVDRAARAPCARAPAPARSTSSPPRPRKSRSARNTAKRPAT